MSATGASFVGPTLAMLAADDGGPLRMTSFNPDLVRFLGTNGPLPPAAHVVGRGNILLCCPLSEGFLAPAEHIEYI
jgi:hypothetical protein